MLFSQIPEHSVYAMIAIIGVLITATIIQFIISYKNPDKDYTELRQRTSSWWWIIALLFLFLGMGSSATIVFFAFISFLALKEFLSIVSTRQADRNVVFWAYIAITLQY